MDRVCGGRVTRPATPRAGPPAGNKPPRRPLRTLADRPVGGVGAWGAPKLPDRDPIVALNRKRGSKQWRFPACIHRSSARKRATYLTREAARQDITRYIEFRYNRKRLHSAVVYRPPCEVHTEYEKLRISA